MSALLSMQDVNHYAQASFVETFGWIFEHSPWVAERAWHRRPFSSLAQFVDAMNREVAAASIEEKLALLRAHPDLGTKAKISASSTNEQAAAGLDQLTVEEYTRLTHLNERYKEKFGFPFLYAVKGSSKRAILEALEHRLGSDTKTEFAEALQQVYRIAGFRLESIIDAGN